MVASRRMRPPQRGQGSTRRIRSAHNKSIVKPDPKKRDSHREWTTNRGQVTRPSAPSNPPPHSAAFLPGRTSGTPELEDRQLVTGERDLDDVPPVPFLNGHFLLSG